MTEIRYDKNHHAGGTPEARIANRLRPSSAPNADQTMQKGSGPTRTISNIHSHGQGAGAGRGPRTGGK